MSSVQVQLKSCTVLDGEGKYNLKNHRTPGDQLEKGRGKFIHTVGAVGRVEWRTMGDHPYTGMFKVG